MKWGDYIVYVDESGDHGLESINPEYPIFVLACCVFKKNVYNTVVVPSFQQFKMDQWGHDVIILHEREIHDKKSSFSFLFNREKHEKFMEELNKIIEAAPLKLITSIIDKNSLKKQEHLPKNPYEIALKCCLERLWLFLYMHSQQNKITHFVVESRGRKEDAELELVFRQICNGGNLHNDQLKLELVFAKKESNSIGLQLADLFARPLGRNYLNPGQSNRAYSLIEPKLYRGIKGTVEGYGLKCFP